MKLTQLLRGMFFGKLRNRAGGLAFVKSYGHEYGADAIAGQVVRTVRFEGGYWEVEPMPVYTCPRDWEFDDGEIRHAGERCEVASILDEVLEPIGSPGEGEQDQTLDWVRVPEMIPLPVREMTRDA